MQRIYLDYNATAPVKPSVLEKTVAEISAISGNPSSTHTAGRKAKERLEWARERIGEALGVPSREILFTSGGTEADNLAIYAMSLRSQGPKNCLTSAIEHPAIKEPLKKLKGEGWQVFSVRPNSEGRLNPEEFSFNETFSFGSLQWANNETGVIQPINAWAELLKERNPEMLLHSDGVQILGKGPVTLKESSLDYASFSGHKIGAFKGVGVLWNRHAEEMETLFHGGPQEREMRPGTENLPGILSFGHAIEELQKEGSKEQHNLLALRESFELELLKAIPSVHIHGQKEERVVNTSSVLFRGAQAELLLMALDLRGFDVSAGSACSSGTIKFSPVIRSMGFSEEESAATLRFSFGWGNTLKDIGPLIQALKDVYELQVS